MINTATADFTCFLTQRFPFRTRTVRVTYRSIRATWRACGNRFAMCAGAVMTWMVRRSLPPVAFLLRHVLHRHGGPVQGVESRPIAPACSA